MNLGMGEILVLLVLTLLLFGAKRLPEIGRSAGSAIREFKKGFESGEPEEKEKADRDNKREE